MHSALYSSRVSFLKVRRILGLCLIVGWDALELCVVGYFVQYSLFGSLEFAYDASNLPLELGIEHTQIPSPIIQKENKSTSIQLHKASQPSNKINPRYPKSAALHLPLYVSHEKQSAPKRSSHLATKYPVNLASSRIDS